MYKWILLGHAIGGATLFGASIYMESLMAGAGRTTDPSAYMLIMLRLTKAANRVMGPASIITLIFGIWVVVESASEFSDLFVTIGLSIIILAFAISMFLMSPRDKEINALIADLVRQIGKLKQSGASIAGFAASAKGNTLLNACGFDSDTVDYIVDDTPEKIGRFSPGTGIPIVDRKVLAERPPDYLLILAWNFASDIIASTAEFSAAGGKYILPIPSFKLVGADGEA